MNCLHAFALTLCTLLLLFILVNLCKKMSNDTTKSGFSNKIRCLQRPSQ